MYFLYPHRGRHASFSDALNLNLRAFVNLDQRQDLIAAAPFLRGTPLALSVDNLTDDAVRVRDETGATPAAFQEACVNPLGRAVSFSVRKQFQIGARGAKARRMRELIIWTLDWAPEGPRGFVRDLRLRWACEEAGLAYEVRTVPFDGRETNHLERQPFGQVPFLSDGDLQLFESGACVLHLARKSETLMPRDPVGEAQTLQWTIAALNSIEMVSVPWWFLEVTGATENGLTGWLRSRLAHIERELKERDWLAAGRFTVADLLMADVLRVERLRAFGDRPVTEAYVARITQRPAFKKAHADQIAHFAAADVARA